MDPVPVRKRKADDDGSPSQPSPASSSAVAADQQQPPRLAIQTNTRPKPSSWISSPRTKRARLDSSSVTPTSSTPPSPSPSPSPSPAVLISARPPPPSPRRSSDHPPPLTVSEIQTSIGLRWLWSSSPPPQRIIVPAFPPTTSPSSPNPNPNPNPSPQPHILIPIDPSSTHIPPRLPPINRTTLAELDMASVLRNPQLRHDLLFDANLQFRPSASRRKRAHADAYWAALARELNTRSACTCVSFDPAGNPAPDVSCVCRKIPCPPEEAPLLAFVPVRARLTLRMPSRLHPLLTELLALLLSLLSPPTTPLPLLHTPQQSPPSSPTTTTTTAPPHSPTTSHHARVLTEALDADLLVQQVRRGLFEPERTFALVAEVMRAHCAPMRDGAVARMAALASTDAVRALRACFEILELMKLDVANHQMHALRPHIVAHAPRFERAIFADRFPVDTESGAVSAPRTRAWLRAADRALEVEGYTLPILRPSSAAGSGSKPNATPAPKAYATLSPRARLPLTLLRALLDLIFPLSSSSPSPSHELPETLHLDGARIGALARDAADLRAVHLLVLLFRQMCGGGGSGGGNGGGGGKGREDVLDAHVGRFKAEMRELWPSALGRVFLAPTPSSTTTTTTTMTNAAQDIPGLSALTLQLSARAAEFRRSPTTMPSEDPQGGSPPEPAPRALTDVVQGWVEKNVRAEAGVARVAGRRMRDAVMDRAARLVLGGGGGGEGGVGAGLEVMEGEVRRLAEGVARAAAIHLAIYRSVYDEGGFLDRE